MFGAKLSSANAGHSHLFLGNSEESSHEAQD